MNENQICVGRGFEFVQQNHKNVTELSHAVAPIFSESQKMSQQTENKTNNEAHQSGQSVWKPCFHIIIAEFCGLLAFFIALAVCNEFKRK